MLMYVYLVYLPIMLASCLVHSKIYYAQKNLLANKINYVIEVEVLIHDR